MNNLYIKSVYEKMCNKYPNELEYLNTVKEILSSIELVYMRRPELETSGVLERLLEPEKEIEFDVEWLDDSGIKHINKGYRIQYSSIMGPYKGGLRFNKNISKSLFKSLALEQTFKNTLTTYPMGGAKGGSDFDPIGKSEAEIERFCHSFMDKLYPYIGSTKDIPAGDIGVGVKEIGYLLDEYKKHKSDIGTITGKPIEKGGLLGRSEATGYGVSYFVQELLRDHNDSFKNKTVIISGIGNVASYTLKKVSELGAKVIGVSDYTGYVLDDDGIKYDYVAQIRDSKKTLKEYLKYSSTARFYENPKGLFSTPCDIALPCATQKEIDLDTAKIMVSNGVKVVGEGSNLPCVLDAINYFLDNNVLFTPAKATNAGGVSASYFEMCQNKEGRNWTLEETDKKLKETMINIYKNISSKAEEYGDKRNLLMGANVWAFEKIVKKYQEAGK